MAFESHSTELEKLFSNWHHGVIAISAIIMVASLLRPNTHLEPHIWMMWFVPFMLVIQAYILAVFYRDK